ncbi:uncharacterized protein LOC129328977 [Eublepharis macularius]|uniref:Uncharacterized protein LOC129328977 n=1 Tax=Eublepharis macularius TaxID=481883 RepID=A0AA97J9W0_EUBMA|nr:uncharacterized protein LOC129328977 [Eublepharis macularius]
MLSYPLPNQRTACKFLFLPFESCSQSARFLFSNCLEWNFFYLLYVRESDNREKWQYIRIPKGAIRNRIRDLGQCPVMNISIPEDSSAVIMPNITTYSSALVLCKKARSSSDCKPIVNVINGKLTYYISEYKERFSVWKHDLVVENASKWLAGEYQLLYQLSEICLQQFFLDVLALGSRHTRYGAIAAIVSVPTLVVLFVLRWKCKGKRATPPSTGVPVLGNGPLHLVATEIEEPGINTRSKGSGGESCMNGIV